MKQVLLKGFLIGASVLLIAGCGSTNKRAGVQAGSVGADGSFGSNAAVASGVRGQSGYAGRQGSGTSTALKAPHNQKYYFSFDRDSVHSQDVASVDAQANYLVGHSKANVRLDGNTDARGSREYNVALGWRRARSVANQLKQDGVSSKQIQTVSYGQERPAAMGHNESAYRQNRRVDLQYKTY